VRKHVYFLYILASRRNGTLYTGGTNDVLRRTWQHKNDFVKGFTKKYGVHTLVWYEVYGDVGEAIAREKQIKGWNRAWKINLVEKQKLRLERSLFEPPRRNRAA